MPRKVNGSVLTKDTSGSYCVINWCVLVNGLSTHLPILYPSSLSPTNCVLSG